MNAPVDDTREAWLGRAAKIIAETLFEGQDVPPIRISVGWPGGGKKETRIGECWPTAASEDGVAQIFLSPIRGESKTVDVIATLAHEMIHAMVDCADGHGGAFKKIAKGVGFGPKFTQSGSRSEELTERFQGIAERMGPFPHAAIQLGLRAADAPKKQTARMLKVVCPDDGYLVRTTAKWLEVGTPTCPCGLEMVAE